MRLSADELPPAAPPLVSPEELRQRVLHDDPHLLVLDKPGWLVVHPSKNGPWSSLAGAARECFGLDKVRLMSRLDRETSGVIVLARDEATGSRIQKSIARRLVDKRYVAILEGEFTGSRLVEFPLGPDPSSNVTVRQRAVPAGSPGAQESTTEFQSLATAAGFTLAGVRLHTGRKHQIRAHADAIGHRVVGDKLYGPDPGLYLEFATGGWTQRHTEMLPLARQALHCAVVDLTPAGMDFVFRAPWPDDLALWTERHLGIIRAEAQDLIDLFTCPKPKSKA